MRCRTDLCRLGSRFKRIHAFCSLGIVCLEVAMLRTMIDLDDALLAEAAEILGTTSKRATVNGALAEFVAAAKRRQFVELLEEGALDDLGNPEVMAGTWR